MRFGSAWRCVMDREMEKLVSELVFAAQDESRGGDPERARLMKRAADAIAWMSHCFRLANERLPVNHRVEDDTISQREAV